MVQIPFLSAWVPVLVFGSGFGFRFRVQVFGLGFWDPTQYRWLLGGILARLKPEPQPVGITKCITPSSSPQHGQPKHGPKLVDQRIVNKNIAGPSTAWLEPGLGFGSGLVQDSAWDYGPSLAGDTAWD